MCIAVVGTAITCTGDFRLSATALLGDLLALGGALCLAGYLLIGRGLRTSVGVASYSSAVYAVVAIVAAVTVAAQQNSHIPSARVALFGLALAVVCTLGGHTVYNLALRYVPAPTVSIAFLGEAPIASVIAVVVLATIPPWPTLLGGGVILSGIALLLGLPSNRDQENVVALEM
jgi:drug/metabolite transporter (DMT)-like permease